MICSSSSATLWLAAVAGADHQRLGAWHTLLGDALGVELLADEACRVGKAAATQLRAAKDQDKAIAGNAASKRTQARKSASKSAEG